MSILSLLPRRRADASSATVLVIVCAGVVLASLDLFIVNVALPDIARDLHTTNLARPVVGAQRLRDRVRVAAGAVRPAGREPPARARVPARRRAVHRRLGRLRRRDQPDDAGRLPDRPGRRRGAADADLAEPGARDDRPRAPTHGASAPGPRSAASRPRSGRSSAACWSPPAGAGCSSSTSRSGSLALVVGWRRLPRVAGHPVPRARRARRGAGDRRRRALTLGLVKGNDWGWGAAARSARWWRRSSPWRCSRCTAPAAANPLIAACLFRSRPFTGSSLVALTFSIAFGAMLLSRVLWRRMCGAGRRCRPGWRSLPAR